MRLIRAAVRSDIGRLRSNNEDNFYFNGQFMTLDQMDSGCCLAFESADSRLLFAVCDGMGGFEAGELASFGVTKGLAAFHSAFQECKSESIRTLIDDTVQMINRDLCALRDGKGAASTLALLYVDGMYASAAWLGDSRVYLLRNGELIRLTRDHTHTQRLVDLGILAPESDDARRKSNALMWYIGIEMEDLIVTPNWSEEIKLEIGDAFLICSDGLTDMVSDDEITRMLNIRNLETATKALIETALNNGGKDNITAMVVNII